MASDFMACNAGIVARMARRFWRDRLRGRCELGDVTQDAWLALWAHPEAVGGLRPKRILWSLQRAHCERRWPVGEMGAEGSAAAQAMACAAAALRADSVSEGERSYLYQNLWAVGTASTVDALLLKLAGAGCRQVDRNTLTRALPRIRKAYPTRAALLGPSLAAWMHLDCQKALAAYAGLPGPRNRTPLRTLSRPSADARAFYDRQLALGWGQGAGRTW